MNGLARVNRAARAVCEFYFFEASLRSLPLISRVYILLMFRSSPLRSIDRAVP